MDVEGEDIALDDIGDDGAAAQEDDDSAFPLAETGFGGGIIDVAPVETPLTTSLEGQCQSSPRSVKVTPRYLASHLKVISNSFDHAFALCLVSTLEHVMKRF